ncbi:Copper-transporting ATPase PAA1 chloroplastic [Bienertia sinuspersici]
MELAIDLDDNNAKHLEVQKNDIGSANVVNVYGDTKSIPGGVLEKESLPSDQMNVDCLIKDAVFQEPDLGIVPELLKVDEKSIVINSLADDAGATITKGNCIVTEVTSANDIIPESLQHNETNLEENVDVVLSEYKDVSRLSIDEDNPTVIEENEELRHTLESSVLLEVINPTNPDIHVCMSKTDFLSLAPRTWLTGASIDACSYVFNRREEEEPRNPRRQPIGSWEKMFSSNSIHNADLCRILLSFLQGNPIKRHGFNGLHHWKRRTIPFSWRSNQNDFDCGIYSAKAMEWYDGGNEKDPITTLSTLCLYIEFSSMPSCYRFGKLHREQKETGSFEELCFVVYNKAISLSKADKEKG